MILENNNLKKKLTDGSFEELYQNTEDFQKLNCAKNTEEVLEVLNKYGYSENSEILTKEVLELLNEINTNDLRNVSGGKNSGAKFIGVTLALLAGVEKTFSTVVDLPKPKTGESIVRLEQRLLDRELSSQNKKREAGKPSIFLKIGKHAAEITIPAFMVFLIDEFRAKHKLPQTAPEEIIKGKETSRLSVLNCLYTKLKDCLSSKFDDLKDLQKIQLVTFINSLLREIDLKLNYFESKNQTLASFLEELYSADDISTYKTDMLILHAVRAYLKMDEDENLVELDELLETYNRKLPASPLANIISDLVHSTRNVGPDLDAENIDENQNEAVLQPESPSQNEVFDEVLEENDYDKIDPVEFRQAPHNDVNDLRENPHLYGRMPQNYAQVDMNYAKAVGYLRKIGYLAADAGPVVRQDNKPLWTIANAYYDKFETGPDLTLQEHISNYNAALSKGSITYAGDEQLVFITLT